MTFFAPKLIKSNIAFHIGTYLSGQLERVFLDHGYLDLVQE